MHYKEYSVIKIRYKGFTLRKKTFTFVTDKKKVPSLHLFCPFHKLNRVFFTSINLTVSVGTKAPAYFVKLTNNIFKQIAP